MGLRFRKSFKVAPRVKLNLNKETKKKILKSLEPVYTTPKLLPEERIPIHRLFLRKAIPD